MQVKQDRHFFTFSEKPNGILMIWRPFWALLGVWRTDGSKWLQKWKKGHFSVLGEKESQKLKNEHIFQFGTPKWAKWSHFCILAPIVRKKVPETLCLINLLGQGAKWAPKWDSGPKSAILEAKMGFWAQNGPKVRFGTPKSLLGVHFASWLKRLVKQRVSWLLFRTFGAKIQKWAHFSTFVWQNAKKG